MKRAVVVLGGAGYTGSVLVPSLLSAGWQVTVIDRFIHGSTLPAHPNLRLVAADVRDEFTVREEVRGKSAAIHLAFVSNDPGYGFEPALGWAINVDAFDGVVEACRSEGCGRLIFASSCSVYGEADQGATLDEGSPTDPLTDYARSKLACEETLRLRAATSDLVWTIVRPATVCGYSPRQRLDLTVNRLCADAYYTRKIHVASPSRVRPSLHIDDLARLYRWLLESEARVVEGQTLNAAFDDFEVGELARIVAGRAPFDVEIDESRVHDDRRSYRVCSDRLLRIGYERKYRVHDAIDQLFEAFRRGALPGAPEHPRFHNSRMQTSHDWSKRPALPGPLPSDPDPGLREDFLAPRVSAASAEAGDP